jgi:hypothetical protein
MLQMMRVKEKTNIIISKGNIISIFLYDLTTGEHFRGQPIYGVVQSIKDINGNETKKGHREAAYDIKILAIGSFICLVPIAGMELV